MLDMPDGPQGPDSYRLRPSLLSSMHCSRHIEKRQVPAVQRGRFPDVPGQEYDQEDPVSED